MRTSFTETAAAHGSTELVLRRALVEAHIEATERAAILGQLAEGVIVTDRRGQITLVNGAAEQLHGMKMLGIAGYTRNAVIHSGVLDAGVQMISKPYTLKELAAKVREVLDWPDT